MTIQFKNETFRNDFTYANSPGNIPRFPFPFPEDEYMYSTNVEPHHATRAGSPFEHAFDVDEHYVAEIKDRALVLADDPGRCQALPHMETASWDFVELVMVSKARDYPDLFKLTIDGDRWHWINKPLQIDDTFIFGDSSTLPCHPMEYIGRQVQGDHAILDQRDGNLWLDAGIITAQADWSLDFDIGMNFFEWHAPVPLAHELGVFKRALKFLLSLPQGQPSRRLNWTLTVNPRLDTSPENYPKWGPDKLTVNPDNISEKIHLRVELQTFWRLPRSNAILFPIRTYLMAMNEVVTQPKWGRRLHRVMRDLRPELVDYKGLSRYHPMLVAWLEQFDDGKPTSPGIFPD